MELLDLLNTICNILMVLITLLGLLQFRIHTERCSFRFGQN